MFVLSKSDLIQLILILLLISTGYTFGFLNSGKTVQETQGCEMAKYAVEEKRNQLRIESNSIEHYNNPDTELELSWSNNTVEVKIDAISKPHGISMQPTIFTDNTVLLDNYEGGKIHSGQIVRFESNEGGYIIHRVQENLVEEKGYLLTKGDNDNSPEKIRKHQITHIVEGILYT